MIAELIAGGVALLAVTGFAWKAITATSRLADARISEMAAKRAMEIAESKLEAQTLKADSEKERADGLQEVVNAAIARGNVDGACDRLLADLQAMHATAARRDSRTVSHERVDDPDALMRPDA